MSSVGPSPEIESCRELMASSGIGAPTSVPGRCWLVGLPEDVERQLLDSLTADDCGPLRASSKSVGSQLVSETYLTDRLDAAIRDKGLSGVLTYHKRCETVLLVLLQWIAAIISVAFTLTQVTVGVGILFVVYIVVWAGIFGVIVPPIDFLLQPLDALPWVLQPLDALPWVQGSIKFLLDLLIGWGIKLPIAFLPFVIPFPVIRMVVRLLGEASFIVRAYRQFWVAFYDFPHPLWSAIERRVRSGLRVALATGRRCFACAVVLLCFPGVYAAWMTSSEDSWVHQLGKDVAEKSALEGRDVRPILIVEVIRSLLCIVGPLFLGIYTAWYVAWLCYTTDEFSVLLGDKKSLDQLSGRALLTDVVIPWLFCILSPVCLVLLCRLLWSELMHELLRIDGRVGYLLRLLYVIEEGGCWDRCVSLIHYLKHSSRLLPSLPIVITAYDLHQVGGRAVFSSRPQASVSTHFSVTA
ncbi:unnamed protein product [Vitrella brassicaformis CCMP3155]|uniref:Uncharacterized protein n=1 Tax=Vitrella brassicaformis (strain CCMP3155) TaxID=1169540 RepID=A0A0G4G3S8_VITBC|nr:unnamed protein product [Vitrella brassicaformis CCMP3155]|eukprot:CEM22721.1 unnamed protein product [Vitrella brassicaformis CCMP3155]